MPAPGACRSCGAPLARHTTTPLCAICRQRARDARSRAPDVPPQFWEFRPLAAAFSAQHMGRVCRAYRSHPFHAALHGSHGIAQATVAGWLGMTQAQVSRIENGPPIRNLDALVHWAVTLRIPIAHLWFDLPRRPGSEIGAPPAATASEPDPAVVASQHEWRLTRRYLNGHRSDLAKAAVALYPSAARLGQTALLSAPEWMPERPVPLGDVALNWTDGPQPSAIDGTEPEANSLSPLRTARHRFDRYTSAIRYVDTPTLFENRPSYRLLDVAWTNGGGSMRFGLSAYFDKLDVAEAIGHEYARAATQTPDDGGAGAGVKWRDLPFRRVTDPFDLASRHVIPAITTLTLCRNREQRTATFLLHWRDPSRVATAGGIYDVIPAGEFQPSSISPWSQTTDLDLWRNIVREYSEELCGEPEHDGSRGTPVNYDAWPFYRAMCRARVAGRLRAYCLGVGLDALTLAATIPTVVVIDDDAFDELFGEVVEVNAEGVTVKSFQGQGSATGIPFTEENVERLLTDEPMAPPGAACLHLAWQHRDLLLDAG
jgi:transcriptional regulator with XRE-family HTH domain